MAAYLTIIEANELAATLPNLAAWNAQPDLAIREAALLLASDRFDLARPYQGRRYAADQDREFPRVAYDAPAVETGLSDRTVVASTIWDWDADAAAAVVPDKVKRAVLYEANAILDGSRDRIQQAIHNGLAGQSIGSASETYFRSPLNAQGVPTLCQEADLVSLFYRRRSGRLQ